MLHRPVLLQESLMQLRVMPEGIYMDATFGRGGHSAALLAQLGSSGLLLAIDQDPEAAAFAKQQFSHDKRFVFYQGSFAEMVEWATQRGVLGQVNGVLMDLGVSSPQLAAPERGFSFSKAGPLDMRMNCTQGGTAGEWLSRASKAEMADIFWRYGEERYAERIANHLAKVRVTTPLVCTLQLAELVKQAHPRWPKAIHPATKVFQAIRMHINQELQALEYGLRQSLEVLAVGGRLAVITFHSLEAKLVKRFIRQVNGLSEEFGVLPLAMSQRQPRLKSMKAIKPNAQEVLVNPRARSAVLRVMEKLI